MRSRLRPLLLGLFFGGVALWVPVEKLFMEEIGFSPASVGVMAAAYAAVVPLLEVPSGILADRWSRRGVLVLGNVGALLSVVVGALSHSVVAYVVAALMLGVYFAMQSGTLEAVVYDTVLEVDGTSDRFERMLGRLKVAESAAFVGSALVGGVLAELTSPRLTYVATIPFIVLSTVAFLSFREPRLHRSADGPGSMRQHLAAMVAVVREQPRLVPIGAALVLTAALTQAVFEFGPLWLVELGSGAGAFGPAWAGLMASLGIGAWLGARLPLHSLAGRAGIAVSLVGAAAVLVVSRDALAATVAQVVVTTTAVAAGIVLTRMLHDAIPSAVRAGLASAVGLATWVTFLPLALVLGSVTERWGIAAAGIVIGGLAVVTAVLVTFVVRPMAADEPLESVVPEPRLAA